MVKNFTSISMPKTKESCCCLWICFNMRFLKSTEGHLKLVEAVLGLICQRLLLDYLAPQAITITSDFCIVFLTTITTCATVSTILLCCYLTSTPTLMAVRSSLFEVVFNAVGSFLYLSSNSFLTAAYFDILSLIVKKMIGLEFAMTKSLTMINVMGIILGFVHAYDAWLALKTFKGVRRISV